MNLLISINVSFSLFVINNTKPHYYNYISLYIDIKSGLIMLIYSSISTETMMLVLP